MPIALNILFQDVHYQELPAGYDDASIRGVKTHVARGG